MKQMIFFNIGWMEHYKGLDKTDDRIIGGGKYVHEHGYGHEILNFQSFDGYMYGFVQAKDNVINIERLSALKNDSKIDDILVVWVATDPNGGTYIVGWYENATVYRTLQKPPQGSARVYNNEQIGYLARAKQEDCKRLPVDKRTFPIPRQQEGGMGQSNVWYADKPLNSKFKNEVLDFMANGGIQSHPLKKSSPTLSVRQPDPYKRKKIEQKAIEITVAHYEKLGYIVDSREKDNLGWDLDAVYANRLLKLEVKGLSGNEIIVELTPNEYAKMNEHRNDYRVCVVTNALSDRPFLSVFSYSNENKCWEDENGNRMEMSEIIGARMRAV